MDKLIEKQETSRGTWRKEVGSNLLTLVSEKENVKNWEGGIKYGIFSRADFLRKVGVPSPRTVFLDLREAMFKVKPYGFSG